MLTVIGVRFRTAGKIYYFDPLNFQVKRGDHVIVETARGVEYGTVVGSPREVEDDKVVQPLKPVLRVATERDDEQEAANKAKEKEVSERYVKELATKTPSGDQLVVNLSGGNQQKVVIAKWLTRDSDILIFDEPTRGIDVGAKNEIYKLMSKLAAEGKSIIMISSEMTEILRLSDRIIVMCEGKVTGNIDISEATQERIMDKATRNID